MTMPSSSYPVVYILDCDNTLLDNDALKIDLDKKLHALLGDPLTKRFWQVYEEVRALEGTVDFPRTFEVFRVDLPDDATLEQVQRVIMEYPFDERLYPSSLATLVYLREEGLPTIVSDGDQVYQPRKIEGSGLAAAVNGQVAIYVHKEDHLDEIMQRWPAPLYVMVDDKARILSETKRLYPHRFVTVHVRQGHYGVDPTIFAPPPDVTIERIGDLSDLTVERLRSFLRPSATTV